MRKLPATFMTWKATTEKYKAIFIADAACVIPGEVRKCENREAILNTAGITVCGRVEYSVADAVRDCALTAPAGSGGTRPAFS